MSIGILALITLVVWIVQINELLKPEEKQNDRKNALLTSFGVLLTTILTVDLFRKFIM